ncbi:rhodoquinone biosynthesis methyltransferase RquA [Jiella sp. M17.18]|uniref:rhodoquinone biosynthesis methyltransferase RquA n=1 Tax=Jiella sp. M17.18 TaxID=3234247 RepID=UPI0034DF6D22
MTAMTDPCVAAGDAVTAEPRAHRAAVPAYLETHYWWAYVHPNAVRIFERQWLANIILWGNYRRLAAAALETLGERLPGRTLQIACVYGNLTERIAARAAASGGRLDVVDVLAVQLGNLRRKLPDGLPVRLLRSDAADLKAADASYDRALIFFLLHEQPEAVRSATLKEAFRVVRPGGRIVVVEYARPTWWHPLRYLFRPVLAALEPFALDLWRTDFPDLLPAGAAVAAMTAERRFGGLYQIVTITVGE